MSLRSEVQWLQSGEVSGHRVFDDDDFIDQAHPERIDGQPCPAAGEDLVTHREPVPLPIMYLLQKLAADLIHQALGSPRACFGVNAQGRKHPLSDLATDPTPD